MAVIGAFLGGSGPAIPAGSGLLRLSWTTGDGQNTQVSFVISGNTQETVQSDSNGYAEIVLPVGEYSVSVSHAGEYNGADPKSVTIISRELTEVSWFATQLEKQPAVFESGVESTTVVYYIYKEGAVVASGVGWTETMVFDLTPGSYTLSLSLYNDTTDYPFTVQNNTINQYDTSSLFCTIGIGFNSPMVTITYNGVQAYSGDGISAFDLVVLRKTQSRTIAATSDDPPSFSGVSTSPVYTVSVPSTNVTPNAQSLSVSITSIRVGIVTIITNSGSLTIPRARYKMLVLGGGGGGGGRPSYYNCASGGGGGGQALLGDHVLEGSFTVNIGSGGAGGANGSGGRSGGSTSLGSYSSYGGSGGINDRGGGGGSGGGGGIDSRDSTSGDAYSFGSGGLAGRADNSSPGSSGDYGGEGGDANTDGSEGVPGPIFDINLPYSGGNAGGMSGGGGGGGGGYSAKGGDGGTSALGTAYGGSGGGGGGGGIAGGDGGKGGNCVQDTYDGTYGAGGLGYGAGGGGAGYANNTNRNLYLGGGGGGGGFGSTPIAEAADSSGGGAGAKGCVVLQWIGDE